MPALSSTFTVQPPQPTAPVTTETATLTPSTQKPTDETSPVNILPAPKLFQRDWADRSIFRAGLIESEQKILDGLPGASVYHIDLQISDDFRHLQGRQEVLYTNQENEPLEEIYFRLFPNLADGSTTISNLAINEVPIEPTYELRQSAMRVPLAPALLPEKQVVVSMDFSIEVPQGEGGNYGTFAFWDDVLALAHFYPLIPVYDDEGWNIEIAPSIGDVIYADSSFYVVRITAPASLTLVASGLESERDVFGKLQTITAAAGPTRDFYIAASEHYVVTTQTLGEITVNSYAPADLEEGSERTLEYALNSLHSFNDHFGPYPFTEFDLVRTTTSALGIEYPGIVALLAEMYEDPKAPLLESVVAHEVGHQWFYSIIGNDQVDEPWLDEAMAQYATLVYYEDVYGPAGADGFRGSLGRRAGRTDESEMPIGLSVRDYSPAQYSSIVYGRGPLFIEALAEEMGQEIFDDFLLDYYQTHQYGIATGESFKHLAEQHCTCDLTPLFKEWVYGANTSR